MDDDSLFNEEALLEDPTAGHTLMEMELGSDHHPIYTVSQQEARSSKATRAKNIFHSTSIHAWI